VVLNLLINAADATPEGSRERYEVRVATSTDAKGRAVIEVSDDGPGIAPHIARRIFDPFFTTKAVGSGMGLGLAICHRIVTQLGGELSFESARGGPTTFRVVLPAADLPAAAETARTATTDPRRARARVLIVDDEPTLLRTVRWLLAGAHDVSVASSGREALDLLREDSRFDVVLADLMMDGVTGMDLYDAVRDVHPGLEKRMVFMTGGPSTRRSHEFLARVSNPRIEKPFSAAELEAAISLSTQAAPNHPI
jgi:two-component system cell cycle sensor histidine kinase/response regulator CckA